MYGSEKETSNNEVKQRILEEGIKETQTIYRQYEMKRKRYNGTIEQLIQIFRGSVWDGNLISKTDRNKLEKSGLIQRVSFGYNIITEKGIEYLVDLGIVSPGSLPEVR